MRTPYLVPQLEGDGILSDMTLNTCSGSRSKWPVEPDCGRGGPRTDV